MFFSTAMPSPEIKSLKRTYIGTNYNIGSNIAKNFVVNYVFLSIIPILSKILVVLADEKESMLSRPTTFPERLRQRTISTCCTSHQQSEDGYDSSLVDTDEFVNNYVSLSELKDYNLVAR